MKRCTKCGIDKDESLFAVRENAKLRSWCKECTRKDNLDRYHSKESTKDAHRRAGRRYLLKKYGLDEQSFLSLYQKQHGCCAICSKEIAPVHEDRYQSCCVDHCHTTGTVRGLLCWDCNVGLGKFFDNPAFLESAIKYLQATR